MLEAFIVDESPLAAFVVPETRIQGPSAFVVDETALQAVVVVGN